MRALFIPVMQQKNIAFNIIYSDHTPRQFMSNSFLLQQIVLNLISNAFKFTQQGELTVKVMRDDNEPTMAKGFFPLLMIIEDTGIGIPEEHLTKIFESFYQINPMHQSQHYNSGLGLAIIKKSIAKLGGKIWVTSEVGKGSRFFVSLPLELSEKKVAPIQIDEFSKNQAAILSARPAIALKQSLVKGAQQLSILVVEDNVLIQQIVISLLNKLNSYVDIAGTATQALELTQRESYDLIFMDIGLPDHDGFWAVKQIRQSAPKHRLTPIVALTAQLERDYPDICLETGFDDIIPKPLTLDNARACLQRFGLYQLCSP